MGGSDTLVTASYVVLAGTGIYCLYRVKDSSFFSPHITFGIITIHNCVGTWNCIGGSADNITEITGYAQLLFALSGITTEVWLQDGYQKEISWAWTIVPIIPFAIFATKSMWDSGVDPRLVDLIVVCNILALGIVSGLKKEYFGVGAAVAHAIASYGFGGEKAELFNFSLCVFAYCGLRAIGFE